MQKNNYRVVVIPDMNKDRKIIQRTEAQNATVAAGSVLSSLPVGFADCIEVLQVQPGQRSKGKVAFYSCLYGAGQGFQYTDRFVVASFAGHQGGKHARK
jgi:hypothetical protein